MADGRFGLGWENNIFRTLLLSVARLKPILVYVQT